MLDCWPSRSGDSRGDCGWCCSHWRAECCGEGSINITEGASPSSTRGRCSSSDRANLALYVWSKSHPCLSLATYRMMLFSSFLPDSEKSFLSRSCVTPITFSAAAKAIMSLSAGDNRFEPSKSRAEGSESCTASTRARA